MYFPLLFPCNLIKIAAMYSSLKILVRWNLTPAGLHFRPPQGVRKGPWAGDGVALVALVLRIDIYVSISADLCIIICACVSIIVFTCARACAYVCKCLCVRVFSCECCRVQG